MDRAALRVLVVDDDPSIRLLCRVNLEAAGLVVDEAPDGIAAVEAALESPPDVALLDGGDRRAHSAGVAAMPAGRHPGP